MKLIPASLFALAFLASALSAEPIAPNENLVAENIPPVPGELLDSIGRYTESRSAVLLGWHPRRREMLIGTRFANTDQVHYVKAPGGARTQLTFFPDRLSAASFGPKNGDHFIFSKDIGGNEFTQIYRFDLPTGDFQLLTDGKSRNSEGVWSEGGERIVYTSTRRNGADTDLYTVRPKDPAADRMLAQVEGGGWEPLDWSPDDRQILVLQFISINESYLWLFDSEKGERKLLTPKVDGVQVFYAGSGRFSADGQAVYAASDKDSEFRRLVRIDLATGEHKVLSADVPWDVEEFDTSRDGKLLAYTTNENGVSVLRVLDLSSGKEIKTPRLPTGIVSSLQWRENAPELGFQMVSARSTSDVYSFAVGKPELVRWTQSETGGLNPETFPEPELIKWKSFDGREISGFLYKPGAKFTGKRPVVVNIHGGPEAQYRPGFLGRNNYYLNELGVATIFPNVRGSEGYGKSFLKLDNGRLREDSVKDIGALLDWIAHQPGLEAERIMVTGGSYGGYMTLAVSTNYPDKIRCSLDVVGVSNFVTFLEKTESYRRDLRRVEYGDERDPEMRKFLESIAPVNKADKITKPLFIVQGKNDPRVPLNEAEQIKETVKKNATPVWYLMAKDEGHGFRKKANADFQFYATVLFMRNFLLNEVPQA